jgi:predicted signal transduction protein with EAL and GGDEF domain
MAPHTRASGTYALGNRKLLSCKRRAFYDSSHAVDPNDSLKYLTQYPVNRLKLAQEFVFRVTIDYRNAAVVRAAIRLANELGIEVIAEGVETEAHVRFLMGAGREQAQGHFFSRPVTVLKATELLRAGRIEPKADPLRRLTSSAA